MNKVGKVYIIGAGPGDYELLTLKAKRTIEEADVVVYDRLVGDRVLMLVKEDAELIYVGKRPDLHVVTQEGINKILVEKALEGKVVARLKGGDPFLFGRGGEEIEELIENNILYEVVPGITSAIAVPAYAGIPVTHRDYASSVHIITGHEKKEKNSTIEYKKYGGVEGTLIFLMGISNLEYITRQLIEGGKLPDTPVAVIQNGTTNQQREIFGTLENIVHLVKENNIMSPAITIVGEVVSLGEKLSWREIKPLNGKTVLVTRVRNQASTLVEKLNEKGAEVFECPTIKITLPDGYDDLDAAIADIGKYTWLIFTSVNGVDGFFNRLKENKIDIRKIKAKIAVVGEETAKALENRGLQFDYITNSYTTDELGEGLAKKVSKKDRILLARSDRANKAIIKVLEATGAICNDLTVYKTAIDTRYKMKLIILLKEKRIDYITFASASTVENFLKLLGEENKNVLANVTVVCIGPVTEKKATECGLENIKMSNIHTIDGIVDTIMGDVL